MRRAASVTGVAAVLLATHPRFGDHDTGPGHPERPARLAAVLDGLTTAGLDDALVRVDPRPATRAELEAVHPAAHLDRLEALCRSGGGHVDADTRVSEASWAVALLAAGAGIDSAERLERGEADAAFLAVRPPGHHATVDRAMGFCLLNNVAVTATHLADRGERVLVVDIDAHHGNGTQEVFWSDPRVLYVSFHQHPLYPGTGAVQDVGTGGAAGEGGYARRLTTGPRARRSTSPSRRGPRGTSIEPASRRCWPRGSRPSPRPGC